MGNIYCSEERKKILCFGERNKNKISLNSENSKPGELSKVESVPPKTVPLIFEQFPNLREFMENKQIQDSYFEREDEDDLVFKELKKYEKEELTKEFENLRKNYEKILKQKNNKYIDNNLINNIFEKENSKMVFKDKILKEIEKVKNDNENEKYNIKYLTILLFGTKGVGKTELVNYILKKDSNDEIKITQIDNNLIKYESYNDNIKLKFIEYKGYGIDKDVDPKTIADNSINYIKNLIDKKHNNKNKNFNDFVHCIWFCVKGTRFQDSEIEVLKKLKEVYGESIMPIIIVYTNAADSSATKEMKKFITSDDSNIKNYIKESDFIKVNSKESQMPGSDDKIPPFGGDKLLQTTLNKCTQSLKGNMKIIMMENMSNNIETTMKKLNSDNKKKIFENIINEFIKNYKEVKKDDDFINYLVNMIGKNLKQFYQRDISNATLNIIFKSNIIKIVSDYIIYYKNETKKLIEKIVEKNAKIFLNAQVEKEIEEKQSIQIKNKRSLNKFKKTNKIFLKKNFYYISQKYLILDIIDNFCYKFLENFTKSIDSQIKNLLEIDKNNKYKYKDKEINDNLTNCFLIKLKNFADIISVEVDNLQDIKISQNNLPYNIEVNDEELYENNSNHDSFELNDDEKEIVPQKNLKNSNNISKDWFPLKPKNKKWEYINEETINIMNDFWPKMNYQDNYFNQLNIDDEVSNALKKYEKKNLNIFLDEKKGDFISNIHNNYKQDFKYDRSQKQKIKSILNNENISSILKERIKIEFDRLNNDKSFSKINYITTIVIGKSGIGKSTLINRLLKLKGKKMAKTGIGKIQTVASEVYKNEKVVPFLRIYDTRGIELNEVYGPEQIFKSVSNIINKRDKKDKNNSDNIQCIWYCITGNIIEEKEKEFIKKISKDQEKLPIIVVYTYPQSTEYIKKIKDEIMNDFKNIPFITVLSKGIKNEETGAKSKPFGLDELIEKTLEMCKNAVKSTTFQKIKNETTEELKNIFNKKNKDNNIKLNNQIVSSIINNFNQVYIDDKFLDYIFNLFEEYLTGFMEDNNNNISLNPQSKKDLNESNELRPFLNKYISDYKNKADKIVTKEILDNKSIEFLDKQVLEEIEKNKNINIDNKNNKENFINIIKEFLNNNFYYIAQKYCMHRLITDSFESFSKDIEDVINSNIKSIISNDKDIKNCFNNIYFKKIEDLIEIFNQFLPNLDYDNDNYDDENEDEKGENSKKKIKDDESNKKGEPENNNLPPAIIIGNTFNNNNL